MDTSRPQLDRVNLSTDSRYTLAALIKLLAPHVPYSLHVLGAIINTAPRTSTLQDIDPSKASLWSTIAIPTADPPALFSVVAFSRLNQQFSVFCSSDSSTSADPPSEAEKTHVKRVFERIRDVAHDARPAYDTVLTPRGATKITDAPMIVVGAVHPKWAEVLEPMSARQSPNVRYALPRGTFARDGARERAEERVRVMEMGLEASEVQASDLPFVHGASSVLRSDAYLLSRAPYSVCLRLWVDREVVGGGERLGRLVACVLMHADESIGALRVDPEYRRQGLGGLVVRMLVEKPDFSKGQDGAFSEDLGGGVLGWNWMDTGPQNETGNCFLSSMAGKENNWQCHWTYMPLDGTFPLRAHYSCK